MRLAIATLLTAILVVTSCVARSTSHKGSKNRHHPIDIFKLTGRTSSQDNDDSSKMSDQLLSESSAPSVEPESDWSIAGDLAELKRSSGDQRKKKKGRPSKKTDWTKKHKRKPENLLSLADLERRLQHNFLPVPPTHPPKQPTAGIECCPTVMEVVQPRGGVNMEGHLVQLFRPNGMDQRIYEHSCRPDVVDQPCHFVDKSLRSLSRCVQQYSYTYALVENHDHGHGPEWRMDYIRVRSGCACEIQPP